MKHLWKFFKPISVVVGYGILVVFVTAVVVKLNTEFNFTEEGTMGHTLLILSPFTLFLLLASYFGSLRREQDSKKDLLEERHTSDISSLEEKVSSLSLEYKDRFEEIATAKLDAIFSVDIKPLIEKKYAEQSTNSYLFNTVDKHLREIIRRASVSRKFYSLTSKLSLLAAIAFAFCGLVIPCLKIYFLNQQVHDLVTLGSLIEATNKLNTQSIVWLTLPYLTAIVILESLAAVCFRIYADDKRAVQNLENTIISMEAFVTAYCVALHQKDTKEINRITDQLLSFFSKNSLAQKSAVDMPSHDVLDNIKKPLRRARKTPAARRSKQEE
ncbi:MAG: hypothetical protein ACK5XX_09790 [Holosporales bacterium]